MLMGSAAVSAGKLLRVASMAICSSRCLQVTDVDGVSNSVGGKVVEGCINGNLFIKVPTSHELRKSLANESDVLQGLSQHIHIPQLATSNMCVACNLPDGHTLIECCRSVDGFRCRLRSRAASSVTSD
jgi:hypothetical protein